MFTGALSFKTFAQQNHGHCHRSQAQGWIEGLHRADPHHAKGCDSLSGKPDVRPQRFRAGLDHTCRN